MNASHPMMSKLQYIIFVGGKFFSIQGYSLSALNFLLNLIDFVFSFYIIFTLSTITIELFTMYSELYYILGTSHYRLHRLRLFYFCVQIISTEGDDFFFNVVT